MVEKDKQKRKINRKMPRKSCFVRVGKSGFSKNVLKDIAKHNLCSEGEKGIVVKICLGKLSFLCFRKHKTLQNRGFSRHMGKTKKPPFVAKRVISERASKRLFTICDPQKLCSAENTIL